MHSALDKSPFEVLYNRQPHLLGLAVADACPMMDLDVWLAERDLMTHVL
jgi:hypothetical protein